MNQKVDLIMQSKKSRQWQQMFEHADALINLHPRKPEGHRHKGDALIMLGQQEQDDTAAIQILTESDLCLRKALGLCNGPSYRWMEKEITQSQSKNAKVKTLKERKKTCKEKTAILDQLKLAMEQYDTLM